MVTAPEDRGFDSRTRTAGPPTLRWAVLRTVQSVQASTSVRATVGDSHEAIHRPAGPIRAGWAADAWGAPAKLRIIPVVAARTVSPAAILRTGATVRFMKPSPHWNSDNGLNVDPSLFAGQGVGGGPKEFRDGGGGGLNC